MKQKNEILPIILGIVTACCVLFAAIILCLDIIMRGFFPGIYLGSRIAGTYNELKKENSVINDMFTYKDLLPSDNMTMTLNGNIDNIGFDFNGQYADLKLYLDGNVMFSDKTAVNTQFFYDNGSYGICLPDYINAWFYKNNNASDSSETASFSDNSSVTDIYPMFKNIVKDAKIKDYSKIDKDTCEYKIYTNGDVWEEIISASSYNLQHSNNYNKLLNSYKETISSLTSDFLSDIDLPQTVIFTVHERDNRIVYANCSTPTSDGNISIMLDMSKSEKLRDSLEINILYSFSGNELEFLLTSSGNHFDSSKKLYNNTNIEIKLPILGKTIIEAGYESTGAASFNYSLNMNTENLYSANVSGTASHIDDTLSVTADNMSLDFGNTQHSGYITVSMKETTQPFNIPQKTQYPLDPTFSDFYSFIKGLIQ